MNLNDLFWTLHSNDTLPLRSPHHLWTFSHFITLQPPTSILPPFYVTNQKLSLSTVLPPPCFTVDVVRSGRCSVSVMIFGLDRSDHIPPRICFVLNAYVKLKAGLFWGYINNGFFLGILLRRPVLWSATMSMDEMRILDSHLKFERQVTKVGRLAKGNQHTFRLIRYFLPFFARNRFAVYVSIPFRLLWSDLISSNINNH